MFIPLLLALKSVVGENLFIVMGHKASTYSIQVTTLYLP